MGCGILQYAVRLLEQKFFLVFAYILWAIKPMCSITLCSVVLLFVRGNGRKVHIVYTLIQKVKSNTHLNVKEPVFWEFVFLASYANGNTICIHIPQIAEKEHQCGVIQSILKSTVDREPQQNSIYLYGIFQIRD